MVTKPFADFIMGGSVAGLRRRRARAQIAVATLSGNSLTQTVDTHRAAASVHQAARLVAALLRIARVLIGGNYWQPTAGFMIDVTCRLTAKNRDQLRNPTLGNRVWATYWRLLFYYNILITDYGEGVRRLHWQGVCWNLTSRLFLVEGACHQKPERR